MLLFRELRVVVDLSDGVSLLTDALRRYAVTPLRRSCSSVLSFCLFCFWNMFATKIFLILKVTFFARDTYFEGAG